MQGQQGVVATIPMTLGDDGQLLIHGVPWYPWFAPVPNASARQIVEAGRGFGFYGGRVQSIVVCIPYCGGVILFYIPIMYV